MNRTRYEHNDPDDPLYDPEDDDANHDYTHFHPFTHLLDDPESETL